jgi:hypothetical protein
MKMIFLDKSGSSIGKLPDKFISSGQASKERNEG